MVTFQKQLLDIKKRYSITTSDLAVLLDVGRSTVFYWLNGIVPYPAKIPLLEKRIERIKKASDRFPIPLNVTQYLRKTYLLDSINANPLRLSKLSSTK